MENNFIKLKQRFVSDFNLPIPITEEPYFGLFLTRYQKLLKTDSSWYLLLEHIQKNYQGNENLFLDEYYELRNKIITTIEESDKYKEFNTADLTVFKFNL